MVPESVVHMVLRLRGDDSSSRTPTGASRFNGAYNGQRSSETPFQQNSLESLNIQRSLQWVALNDNHFSSEPLHNG